MGSIPSRETILFMQDQIRTTIVDSNTNKDTLDQLNQNIAQINRKLGNFWLSLGKGFLTGFGYVLGAGVAIILIGWFLNGIGVIPALRKTADQWRDAFQQTQSQQTFIPDTQSQQNSQ